MHTYLCPLFAVYCFLTECINMLGHGVICNSPSDKYIPRSPPTLQIMKFYWVRTDPGVFISCLSRKAVKIVGHGEWTLRYSVKAALSLYLSWEMGRPEYSPNLGTQKCLYPELSTPIRAAERKELWTEPAGRAVLLQGERTGLGKCLPWQEELPDVVVLQELGVVHCSLYLLYLFFFLPKR